MTDPTNIQQSHFADWKREISSHADGDLATFLGYFDSTTDPVQYYRSGFWDFSYHILKPAVLPLIGEPYGKTSLEIGFGGGRLIQAAANYFSKAIGVDIHPETQKVAELLKGWGLDNVELHQTEGLSFPLADASIDFAYSYIVLQHLPTIDALRSNIVDLFRVLKPGGAGVLHFGWRQGSWLKPRQFSDLTTNPDPLSRNVTLRLTVALGVQMLTEAGFKVLEAGRSHKKPWQRHFGGQFYALIQKPGFAE